MSDTTADSEAFEAVTTSFYRLADSGPVGAATRHLLRMLSECPAEKLGGLGSLLYLLTRMMQVSPQARAECTPVLRGYTGPHAEFPRRILEVVDDPSFPNAVQLPIEGPHILDLLWAEFFVTGASEPILKIISTLDWPDGIRRNLDHWLGQRSLLGGSKRRATADLLASSGIVVDLDAKAI